MTTEQEILEIRKRIAETELLTAELRLRMARDEFEQSHPWVSGTDWKTENAVRCVR